jgi:hypothetical protein
MDALRADVDDLAEIDELTVRLYEGRLTERNRSMVILANRHAISTKISCSFLNVDPRTARRYLKVFETTGVSGLFAPQAHSTSKFDDPLIKNAVFGLLHEPPSNYGINRTTWTMMVASTEVGRTKLALRAQRLSLKSSSDIARRVYRQYCPVCPAGSNLEMLKNLHMLTFRRVPQIED